ncbi:hypothetical protein CSA17_00800 [bacterium DOLJORAL78_65_58]|nr:MAG: hypothetical protein CSB20_02155 [bacterium DOLZORAL124_64_63]PIE76709.1 MAG: hypothetical protein CSA17_00800 [bacterium DOLJORAL78_65_58]
MSDPRPVDAAAPRPAGVPRVAVVAALLVLVLAVGAVIFPRSDTRRPQGRLLAFVGGEPGGARREMIQDLGAYLAEQGGHPLEVVTVRDRERFLALAAAGADFALCPDGLALGLEDSSYASLAAGRRKMPSNLWPRGVLVYRRSAAPLDKPWTEAPARTVFGDSLSLSALGGVEVSADLRACAFGPDPYDHGPVLHALRLGAFDYALVRQWDAEAFFTAGLLDAELYELEMMTDPVPDMVLMVHRKASVVQRMAWAEALSLLGTGERPVTEAGRELAHSLSVLGLAGFDILLELDFDRLRGRFGDCWPPATP